MKWSTGFWVFSVAATLAAVLAQAEVHGSRTRRAETFPVKRETPDELDAE